MPAQLPTPTSMAGSPAQPPAVIIPSETAEPVPDASASKEPLNPPPQPQEPDEPSPASSPPSFPSPLLPVVVATVEPPVRTDAVVSVETTVWAEARSSTPQSPKSTTSHVSRSAPGSFVVWSRKPRDPSKAVGVIISSRAHPPPNILGKSCLRPPVLSPESPSEALHVPSSSATETTPPSSMAPDTPVPGSPLSSNTSVSVAAAPPSPGPEMKQIGSPTTSVAPVPQEKPQPAPSVPTTETEQQQPPAAESVQPEAEATPALQAASPTPSVEAKSTAPPVKKSWASLLQSDATASSSKSRLPTSSVVGFSIPAGLQNGSASHSTSSANAVRPELLNLLNAGPTGHASPPRICPRGLINTGNMCFANAVLQVLVYCQPFYRLFTELGKYLESNTQKDGPKTTPLVDATIQFLKEFEPKKPDVDPRSKGKERQEDFDDLDSFIPTYVYDVMKEKKRFASMVGGHQEDAEEFLGFFLDTLEEELLSLSQASIAPKAEEPREHTQDDGWMEVGKRNRLVMTRTVRSAESPITRIFGGKFRSTLKAPHQRDSVTVEDWRSLRLDIQREQVHTIQDALQFISTPHSVEITSPTRPGVVIEASRQELVEALPPVLILHLKRFLYDTNVGDVVKIGKHVTFGPDLEIGSELLSPTRRTSHPVKYQLFGALYHHGQSASGGHYTLDVLHPNRDMNDRPRQAWIRIDDELVSDMRPEDVFGGQERDDRCAYLLFYRRLGPAKTWSQAAS
ncbi:hypothetical protein NM688_g7738 [Phlebia brevispora]|uniref:Uncharacterized protein n=1 Tax=Phlebia brevispora TaxID=194682 RepID=A0ACC1S1N6_9APHY|nr:hypothetical protein NM688_g7738 [Phlebia brevispora]